jgi:hypothetical protein
MTFEQIEQKLKAYHHGFGEMPKEYIDYHLALAAEATQDLTNRGYTIHRKYTASDGWFDGMRTTYVIVETPSQHLVKLHWQDSHGTGSWFEHFQGHGGSSPHKLQGELI